MCLFFLVWFIYQSRKSHHGDNMFSGCDEIGRMYVYICMYVLINML